MAPAVKNWSGRMTSGTDTSTGPRPSADTAWRERRRDDLLWLLSSMVCRIAEAMPKQPRTTHLILHSQFHRVASSGAYSADLIDPGACKKVRSRFAAIPLAQILLSPSPCPNRSSRIPPWLPQ
jgi:hypothetical protein